MFSDRSDWQGGFAEDLQVTAQGAATLQGWTLTFTLADDIQQIWGAQIISHVGTQYVLGNVGFNAAVSAANPASFGFVASGPAASAPTGVVLNGINLADSAAPLPVTQAITPQGASPVAPIPASTIVAPTIVAPPIPAPPTAAPPIPVPTTAAPPTLTPVAAALLPSGYLSTRGNEIVGGSGAAVQINAVNWFGMETNSFSPHGLDTVNYKATMQQMASLGFNAIRLPFSLQSLDPASMPAGIDAAINPDLVGLNAVGVLDRIVAEAGTLGLKLILDDHSSAAGGGPNPNGLWYDGGYSQADFTNDWVKLAAHYAGNGTVIGFDLSNEPHGQATWGDGQAATDWQMAATQTGNAVQAVNPNALIIVEGVQNNAGVSTAWGENLTGVAAHPVVLQDSGKLVYSSHDYPASVTGNAASNDPTTLAATWSRDWGYIQQQDIAPVLVGEFGSKLATPGDQAWMQTFVQYLAGNATAGSGAAAVAQAPVSWAYWDWNPAQAIPAASCKPTGRRRTRPSWPRSSPRCGSRMRPLQGRAAWPRSRRRSWRQPRPPSSCRLWPWHRRRWCHPPP